VENGHKDIIELLVKKHPELISIKDKRGRLPLDLVPKNREELPSLL